VEFPVKVVDGDHEDLRYIEADSAEDAMRKLGGLDESSAGRLIFLTGKEADVLRRERRLARRTRGANDDGDAGEARADERWWARE
jgi:hypothetical protein